MPVLPLLSRFAVIAAVVLHQLIVSLRMLIRDYLKSGIPEIRELYKQAEKLEIESPERENFAKAVEKFDKAVRNYPMHRDVLLGGDTRCDRKKLSAGCSEIKQ
jgi:hypothetical protein